MLHALPLGLARGTGGQKSSARSPPITTLPPDPFVQHASHYRADIDGLRGVAILLVVLYHANAGLPGGFIGVDVFFVISGFLITNLVLRDVISGSFQYREFWERRIRRLLPALLLTILMALGVGAWACWPDEYADLGASATAQQALVSNIYFWRTSGYFQLASETKPLVHTWSLAIEEQFYLLLPPALVWLARRRRPVTFPALATACAASLALCLWALPRFPGATFYLLPTRAWELLAGSLLAIKASDLDLSQRARTWLGAAGCASLAAGLALLEPGASFPGLGALLPVLGTCAIILAGTGAGSLISCALQWRPLVALGLISYSLYLLHWPALALARNYWGSGVHAAHGLLVVAACVPIAYAMWAAVETPLRRPDGPLRGNRAWALLVCSSLVVCTTGLWIWRSDGLASRFPAPALKALAARSDARNIHEAEPGDLEAQRVPTLGQVNGKHTCLLWGDSYAMALAPGLDWACQQLNVKLIQVTRSMTPPVLGLPNPQAPGRGAQGVLIAEEVLAWVRQHRPHVVVLCAAWHGYHVLPEFETRMRASVEKLRNAGQASPLLVMNTPWFVEDVPLAIARAIRDGRDVAATMTRLVGRADEAATIAKMLQTAVEGTAVSVDLGPLFWGTNGMVAAVHEGRPLFRDWGHLSAAGSEFVAPTLRDSLARALHSRVPDTHAAPAVIDPEMHLPRSR